MDFNLSQNEKFADYVFRFLTAINLYETTTDQFFGVPSKTNILNYWKRLLNSPSFPKDVSVRLDFSSCTSSKA